MNRAIACLLLLAGGFSCEGAGCGADEETGALPEVDEAPVADEQPLEPDEEDEGERFQVFGYDLEPYGAARGTWTSVEIDGARIVRTAERGTEGSGRVIATRDGEPVASIHVLDGVVYAVRDGECKAAKGAMADAMRRIPGMVPLKGVAVTVYGVLGDGVPERASEPLDAEPPSELAAEGVRFESEHDTALYDVTVQGTAWRDAEGRPVRSQGTLDLRPRVGDEVRVSAEWSFAIEKVEEPAVTIPAECESTSEQLAAMGSLPRLDGNRVIAENQGNLVYRAPGTVESALELYRADLEAKGWEVVRHGLNERTGTFVYRKGGNQMTVIATKRGDEVNVVVSYVK